MEEYYPRYPVDFYRRYLTFSDNKPLSEKPEKVIFDTVRENPFGTAFTRRADGERTFPRFS